jgi:23S rRNA pseudouridine1911/1915/1917 synthase
MRHFDVPKESVGLRLDQFIAAQRPEFSRSYWTEQIKKGFVQLNGQSALPKTHLVQSDKIEVSIDIQNAHGDPMILIASPVDLNIIHETEHYCVINKPAGLVVHPGAGISEGTLANGLVYLHPHCQNLPNWGLVHRLDKDTTGLMVVAKTLEGYCHLNAQMLNREVSREYRALVMGQLRMNQRIESYLSRDPKNRLKKRSTSHPEYGKLAITHVKVKQHYAQMTDIICILETGRTHQIRVHLESIGHPLIGEQLYSRHPVAKQMFGRQALHAATLKFKEPCTDKESLVTFHAPLPDDFEELLSRQQII